MLRYNDYSPTTVLPACCAMLRAEVVCGCVRGCEHMPAILTKVTEGGERSECVCVAHVGLAAEGCDYRHA
jgi:hypothetical protein